ncbi:MAG: tail fiber protein [Rhizobacter sp.]|nr:tail fiber protein [Ferruginibacter sp.]
MKKIFIVCALLFLLQCVQAQNVGIGVPAPTEKLEVAGIVKANNIAVTDGNQYDLVKKGPGNTIIYSKGHKAVGLNYIIAIQGQFPGSGGGAPNYSNIIIGEIRLFAGGYVPTGFALCNGQILTIASNSTLFAVIGAQYGGNGTSTFALPDLRGAVPVGFGTPANGAGWTQGEVN